MKTWIEASFTIEEQHTVRNMMHLMNQIRYKQVDVFQSIEHWSECFQVLDTIYKYIGERLQKGEVTDADN